MPRPGLTGGNEAGHADTPLGPTGDAQGSAGTALIAALPSAWIPETRLRLEAFRRVALAGSAEEVTEIRSELRDRFGRLPPEAAALLDLAELRCLAEAKGVARVAAEGPVLRCHRLGAAGAEEPVLQMGRFPRLTARDPLRKLAEIRAFLARLPSP